MRLPAISTSPPVADVATVAPPAVVAAAPSRAAAAPTPPAKVTAPTATAATAASDDHALRELVDKLSQTIGTTGQQVLFSIDRDTHQTVLRVTDAESGAVLRQIPGDEALSMARILDRMQGVLIRQKA